MSLWHHIAEHISQSTGTDFSPSTPSSIGGGCINSAFKISDDKQTWFVKTNTASSLEMFECEAEGLNELAAPQAIRVPRALCTDVYDSHAYIVMDYLQLGRGAGQSQQLAGEQLAALHQSQAERFGWHRNNTIGATHQPNSWTNKWADFYREHRLGFQLDLAARNGYGGSLQKTGDRLMSCFEQLIDHDPQPSLIHGDLWGGNLGFDQEGQPVIYDPATYYGDREAEIAMTELFGGFSQDFYAAYNDAWPLDSGYRVRKTLYNLYHILNHLNLFGTGYAGQAQNMMDRLLAECR